MRVASAGRIAALLALPFTLARDKDPASLASVNDVPAAGYACSKISPGPVSFNSLAGQFTPQILPDAVAMNSIRQTLALYVLAIDGHKFRVLERVFTANTRANYSDPIGVLNGVQAVIDILPLGLNNFASTHHHLGTQYIQVCSPTSAVSVTYFEASHFFSPYTGVGNPVDNSKVLIDRAQHQDTWARQKDGTWKITNRNLVRMGPPTLDGGFPTH